jgi:hypothetical protein
MRLREPHLRRRPWLLQTVSILEKKKRLDVHEPLLAKVVALQQV